MLTGVLRPCSKIELCGNRGRTPQVQSRKPSTWSLCRGGGPYCNGLGFCALTLEEKWKRLKALMVKLLLHLETGVTELSHKKLAFDQFFFGLRDAHLPAHGSLLERIAFGYGHGAGGDVTLRGTNSGPLGRERS